MTDLAASLVICAVLCALGFIFLIVTGVLWTTLATIKRANNKPPPLKSAFVLMMIAIIMFTCLALGLGLPAAGTIAVVQTALSMGYGLKLFIVTAIAIVIAAIVLTVAYFYPTPVPKEITYLLAEKEKKPESKVVIVEFQIPPKADKDELSKSLQSTGIPYGMFLIVFKRHGRGTATFHIAQSQSRAKLANAVRGKIERRNGKINHVTM